MDLVFMLFTEELRVSLSWEERPLQLLWNHTKVLWAEHELINNSSCLTWAVDNLICGNPINKKSAESSQRHNVPLHIRSHDTTAADPFHSITNPVAVPTEPSSISRSHCSCKPTPRIISVPESDGGYLCAASSSLPNIMSEAAAWFCLHPPVDWSISLHLLLWIRVWQNLITDSCRVSAHFTTSSWNVCITVKGRQGRRQWQSNIICHTTQEFQLFFVVRKDSQHWSKRWQTQKPQSHKCCFSGLSLVIFHMKSTTLPERSSY